MHIIKTSFAFLLLGLVSACASFPAIGGKHEAQNTEQLDAARMQVASLEAEIEELKSENARLSEDLVTLQQQRDRQAVVRAPDMKDPEPELPPAPEAIVQDPASRAYGFFVV